jgi:glycine/D-amino acid oxidase-like deaminating enzyme
VAGVAAYPTRPPMPVDFRARPDILNNRGDRLRSEDAWWLLRNGPGNASRRIAHDFDCGVAVIGAGITGALVAHALAEDGHEVVVLDRRDRALGSTAASTALLQYEIDAQLSDLTLRIGLSRARRAYQACVDAIGLLDALDERLGRFADFHRCESVYLASRWRDRSALIEEMRLRQESGIHVDFLRHEDLMARYGANRRCALHSPDAASVDPVRFARGLLRDAERLGARVYGGAKVGRLEPRTEQVMLHLADGHVVRARHAIVCAGYESLPLVPARIAALHTTFATVSHPAPRKVARRSKAVFWETARPYLYVRETRDGRVIVGGQDIPFRGATLRNALIKRQARRLMRRYAKLFGEKPKPAFAWAGHFADTEDGLPFIGSWPGGSTRIVYALCFGGNGMVYAAQAREMIRTQLRGERHGLEDVFGFERVTAAGQRRRA